MKFGAVALDDAEGAILAHSIHLADGVLRKGRVLDAEDVTRLRKGSLREITVARLEPGDLDENDASRRLAEACAGDGLEVSGTRTGRANLKAAAAGVVLVDEDRIHRMNAVDEALTVITARPFEALAAGQVAATVKVITFGVAGDRLAECAAIAADGPPPVRLAPFRPRRIGFIQTEVSGLKESIVVKSSATMRDRLAELGLAAPEERRCGHTVAAVTAAVGELAAAGCEITLILGASAIVDRRDVVPSAVVAAGGEVEHLGMPVDPGNLTLLARVGGMRVLGIPGSARSPRQHGFDWILQRLVAGLDVTPADIVRMGVGGLLKDIPGRPVPRDHDDRAAARPRIGALLLTAGQSRRMGPVNKLLVEVDGEPMVRHAVRALSESRADPIIAVLGHDPDKVEAALAGFDVSYVRNPDFAAGLSTSLKAGLAALPDDLDGVVVALGDMPNVTAADIDALIAAFAPGQGRAICVPTFNGKRGNPVLWSRRFFAEMARISGDVGARHLIGENADAVHEIARENPGILLDLDTPEALAAHLADRPAGRK